MRNSMNSSGRSLIGKYPLLHMAEPDDARREQAPVATTTPRRRTQNDTARRSTRYDIIARMRHDGCGGGASAGLTFRTNERPAG